MHEITAATQDDFSALQSMNANEWNLIFECVEKGERQLYLIKDESEILGYATLNYKPKYHIYKNNGIPEIQDVYIEPSARRNGLGAELLEFCESCAKAAGAEQVGISVSVSADFGIAQHLYFSRGYDVDGNGVTYDREPVQSGQSMPVDEHLCLMLVKDLI